jgi:DNA-binding CsgD family transcriptional regulator
MDRVASALIDCAEAAYDLEVSEAEWLPKLLQAGLPVFDHGLVVVGVVYARPPKGGPVVPERCHVVSGPQDFADAYAQAVCELPVDVIRSLLGPGVADTISERSKRHPGAFSEIGRRFDHGKDGLQITAVDPNGLGVQIIAALPKVTKLTGRIRERWQMLAAHVCAGHRIRRAVAAPASNGCPKSPLPHDAEAVLDPKRFEVTDATGPAKAHGVGAMLRDAAIQGDRARGRLRSDDPHEALEIWKALVQGRWSLVDWFDTDGRRFVLAVPNPPDVVDPRGLTEREMQVVTYASFGHSNKLIGYQLGISGARVSTLLSSSMRKLGARTHAQLVKKIGDLRGLRVKEAQQHLGVGVC